MALHVLFRDGRRHPLGPPGTTWTSEAQAAEREKAATPATSAAEARTGGFQGGEGRWVLGEKGHSMSARANIDLRILLYIGVFRCGNQMTPFSEEHYTFAVVYLIVV